jgi:hypothetical protein
MLIWWVDASGCGQAAPQGVGVGAGAGICSASRPGNIAFACLICPLLNRRLRFETECFCSVCVCMCICTVVSVMGQNIVKVICKVWYMGWAHM